MTNPDPAEPVALRAGPIRCTLQDGQLRYLRVGDTEVCRRIYFAVRDGKWATIMPHFTEVKVEERDGGFTVHLSAECRREPVDFSWSGRIEGSGDGKITFHAEGTPGADFQSNRIGLCVLYGTSLVGEKFQTFESADGTGEPVNSEFPRLVSPSSNLVGKHFRLLRYATPEGLHVSGAVEGAIFDMEDQRNWGDSSFKAYAPLSYHYPGVTKGDKKEQTVTLTVTGSEGGKYAEADTLHIRIGGPVEGAKLPRLVEHDASFDKPAAFVDINNNRPKYADAKAVTWPYTSTTHLPDDDTVMETPPALTDQAKTIRSFAPHAALRVGPIRIESSGKPRDPRVGQPIAEAWAAEVIRAMALGGVEEAEFDLGPARSDGVLDRLRNEAGAQVLSAEAVPAPGTIGPAFAVQALAFQTKDGPVVWVLNRTPRKASAVLEGLGKPAKVWRLGNSPAQPLQPDRSETTTRVDLGPYEVVRVEPATD